MGDSDPGLGEIFYFCHLHTGMSGRIRLQDADGQDIPVPNPIPLYKPYQADQFDAMCGTYEVSDYAPGEGFQAHCRDLEFLCGNNLDSEFGRCMRAIDCKMNRQMRVVNSDNHIVTFMHQMIPHHDNAVNMAKILLKKVEAGEIPSGEVEEGAFGIADEDVEDLLWNIINTQNEQITFMNTWLEENGYERYDRRGGPTQSRIKLCPPGPATIAQA